MAVFEEELLCYDCVYYDNEDYEEPCCNCKSGIPPSDPRYKTAPTLWKDKYLSDSGDDVVSHPTHYTNGGMECIDEMILVFGKEAVANFCLCNVWKYRYRALSKNGEEDIKKSHWYMAKYKELTKRCPHGSVREEEEFTF